MNLLKDPAAQGLYEGVKDLPIIDFHNHISINDIAVNRCFSDLTEIWLAPDPYKHRLMRICGVPEEFITGSAGPREKFQKFCEVFPYLAGNPVFDWSQMELKEIFGIEDLPSKDTADRIYDQATERLQSPEFSNNSILGRFRIAYQSPVAELTDDLGSFDGNCAAPSLRGDNLLLPSKELLTQLAAGSLEDYLSKIGSMLIGFDAAGCRFADHALDDGFTWLPNDEKNEARFAALAEGKSLSAGDAMRLKSHLMVRLGSLYAARGWTLLLHLDAKRKTSARLSRLAGPAGGYAAVGGSFDLSALCDMLSAMEQGECGLPKTVLFPLNMSDLPALAVLQGSFSQDGLASKVQLGPAWWWCDHKLGMRNTFETISSFGVLSQFIGMTTDSRSILSFVRHDYFRQVLCSWMAEKNAEWELSEEILIKILIKMCYENAHARIERN